jgi:hypothetical protein
MREDFIMTENQERLYIVLQELEQARLEKWGAVVAATNVLVDAMEQGEEVYDAGFPPELERAMDGPALDTAWIYDRLEEAGKVRRNTRRKIRKALGYNVG